MIVRFRDGLFLCYPLHFTFRISKISIESVEWYKCVVFSRYICFYRFWIGFESNAIPWNLVVLWRAVMLLVSFFLFSLSQFGYECVLLLLLFSFIANDSIAWIRSVNMFAFVKSSVAESSVGQKIDVCANIPIKNRIQFTKRIQLS